MHRPAASALALGLVLAACGGKVDLPADLDALGDDAGGDVDAPIDADGDAGDDTDAPPPAPFSGRFSVLEIQHVVANAPAPLGQGLQVELAFTENSMLPPPVLEEQAGPLGCKVWEYTPAQATHARVGIDEGSFAFTFAGGSNPGVPPAMPSCRFAAGLGYRCVDFATSSSGGVIAAGAAANTAVLTDPDVTYSAANSLGRWLRIEGSDTAGNDGLFPIVGLQGDHGVVYLNPARSAEILPGLAAHVNIGGVGPIPGVTDPGFLADDAALTVFHTAGGANHVPSFNVQTEAPGHVGDDFALDAPSFALLTHVPRDGLAMTFTCETNCGADNAPGSVVTLVTTDAPVAGLPPTAMPPATGKRVEIRCAQLGTGAITVPAAYAAKLASAGATRVQATFIRGADLAWPEPPVTGTVGHALAGFTTF